jgi:hypothetical protein
VIPDKGDVVAILQATYVNSSVSIAKRLDANRVLGCQSEGEL